MIHTHMHTYVQVLGQQSFEAKVGPDGQTEMILLIEYTHKAQHIQIYKYIHMHTYTRNTQTYTYINAYIHIV